jgi:hypothetical protein
MVFTANQKYLINHGRKFDIIKVRSIFYFAHSIGCRVADI